MTITNLFIPTKIKVGYQKREDTYSKKLAYVIYYDEKNILRKEKSWLSWINETMPQDEFDNEPLSGFILNRKAGGTNYGWNPRQTYCRVYDPRGFEIEISIPNLLFILQECDSNKGKALEGEFVYSWQGTELVLLPAHSAEFKNSKKFTSLQSGKISKKDLVPGHSYYDKYKKSYIYLGYFKYNSNTPYYGNNNYKFHTYNDNINKKHVFLNNKIYYTLNPSNLKEKISDIIPENFSNLVSDYLTSIYSREFSHVKFNKINDVKVYDYFYSKVIDGKCKEYYVNFIEIDKVTNIKKFNFYKSNDLLVSENNIKYVEKEENKYNYFSWNNTRKDEKKLSLEEIQNNYFHIKVITKPIKQ